jgi:hypothetical protein
MRSQECGGFNDQFCSVLSLLFFKHVNVFVCGPFINHLIKSLTLTRYMVTSSLNSPLYYKDP